MNEELKKISAELRELNSLIDDEANENHGFTTGELMASLVGIFTLIILYRT